jgi:GGDEF domain-containing protein
VTAHATALTLAVAAAGVVVIGGIDYATGTEYRVFALYYLPLSLIAWRLGLGWTLGAVAVCTASWFSSNYLAGLRYSDAVVWTVNVAMQGASLLVVGVLITRLGSGPEREQHLSRIDPLTSLLNVRAFDEEADRVLAQCRRYDRAVTLAYLDIDGFKAVNDTLGHAGGDAVLHRTADWLRRSVERIA